MAKLSAKLEGVPSALKKTRDLSRALDRVGRAMFGEIGEFMVASTKKNFSEQVSPSGKKWKKLNPSTAKAKGHRRILFKTGALNRGVQIVSLDKHSVSVGVTGTEAQKGIHHQFGTGDIPARPFLGFSKPRKDLEKIKKITARHLKAEAQKVAHGN